MSDVLIVSCRLCLQADELTSMVTVDRLCGSPVHTVSFSICRPCARAIAAALEQLDTEGAKEVTDDAATLSERAPGTGDAPGDSPTGDSLVLPGGPADEGARVDSQESDVPARRARRGHTSA